MYCNVHNNDADGVVTMVTTRNRTYCLKETAHIVSNIKQNNAYTHTTILIMLW